MRFRDATLAIAVLLLTPACSFACSCSNDTPIQKSSERYRQRAVFTARIIHLFGDVETWGGKRYSDRALAVVHERHWGVPWYWPKVVMLDGSYPCDIALWEGEEYLVSGRPVRYGVVNVAGCSRTQPLATAQLDIRTLDGTHCSAPGGTIIGYTTQRTKDAKPNTPAPHTRVTVADSGGREYSAISDEQGLYEIQHLPPDSYKVVSRLDGNQYLEEPEPRHVSEAVTEGICVERWVRVEPYRIAGRLPPDIYRFSQIELVEPKSDGASVSKGRIQPDGGFYFDYAPDGEYLLRVQIRFGGQEFTIFHPGVSDIRGATRVRVAQGVPSRSFHFRSNSLPIVAIPVVADFVPGSEDFRWSLSLQRSDSWVDQRRVQGKGLRLMYGFRGETYRLTLNGESRKGDIRCSADWINVTAQEGIAPIHMTTKCGP